MTEIHESTPNRPIVTKYEPGFKRFYAKGGLVSRDGPPDPMIRLAFWSSKVDLKMEDESEAVGYSLEAEAILTLDGATRVRDLLTFWLEKQRGGHEAEASHAGATPDPSSEKTP